MPCVEKDYEEDKKIYSRPPLGIEPHDIWIQRRIEDLLKAMNRYVQSNMQIPVEWVEEYNKLIKNL
jgi:hypothetical protein